MTHKFQIHLHGIIDLLSHHLYSGPEVFLRELLQNGVDAIRARCYRQPDHQGEITIEVVAARGRKPGTVVFTDNGIGLNEDEIHRFLATIGESSKRGEYWDQPTDFIGRFGIGLLSCFVVSDEIVVLTQSLDTSSPSLEWRGKPDGTYTIKTLDRKLPIGTQVFLTGKPSTEELFRTDRIRELALHFGGLLPYPIRVISGPSSSVINEKGVPWRQEFASDKERSKALLRYGKEVFGTKFLDAIPLRSEVGRVDGVGFILPHPPNLATKRTHRVYLKNMLLTENADNLLPDWAFFIKAVVNADDLRPTASRESFHEDASLAAARDELGNCLKRWLVQLAKTDMHRLKKILSIHHLAIKALAVQDDEIYRLFIPFLPFETTLGEMTLAECCKHSPTLRYTPDVDQFRQLAEIATAQGLCILNGGFAYHRELIERYPDFYADVSTEMVEASELVQEFAELTDAESQSVARFVQFANHILQPFDCSAEVRKFDPPELPALYSIGSQGRFLRSVEQSKEIADELWSGLLDQITQKPSRSTSAQLCFNLRNALIARLVHVQDRSLLRRAIQVLYVQSLLLGHQPLSSQETALLTEGMLGLIEWGLDAAAQE